MDLIDKLDILINDSAGNNDIVDENLGDNIKKSIVNKKNEMVKSMSYIKNLVIKTSKLTKDSGKIRKFENEIRDVERGFKNMVETIDELLKYLFLGT